MNERQAVAMAFTSKQFTLTWGPMSQRPQVSFDQQQAGRMAAARAA